MKPKIIFISGIPASGKTTIARMLALKLHIDKVVDFDQLKYSCCMFIDKEKQPYLWTTSHQANKIENLNFIEGYKKYCDCLQSYLVKFLEYLNKEKYIIVEGAQLTPEIQNKLSKNDYDFIYFNIYLKNKEKLKKNINKKLKIRQGKWLEYVDNIWEIQEYNSNLNNQKRILNNNPKNVVKKIIKELKNESFYN